MATLTIFAGINGAGKTTLYNKLKESGQINSDYICPDDILATCNWDWRNANHRFSSGKIAWTLINDYLASNKSFCWETTVFGSFALKTIQEAKDKGYKINLHYIYVDNVKRSLQRIQNRVNEGGHGINKEIVENKFIFQTRHLAQILTMVDTTYIYDNKKSLQIKGVAHNNSLTFWNFNNKFTRSLQEELNALQSTNEQ